MKYTQEQIQFIIKFTGSHKELAKAFKDKFGIQKTSNALQKVKREYSNLDLSPEGLLASEKAAFRAKSKMSEMATLNKTLVKDMVNSEDFLKELKAITSAIRIPKVKPYKIKKKTKIKRVLNLLISDTHFGSNIQADETGVLSYGPVEEARRLALIVKEVIEYKPQYRDETSLIVNIMGDIIDNQLHDPRVGAPLAEQSARAIFLINQMIAQFSSAFPNVTMRYQTGNHGRNTSRHHGRATNQKWDSIETIVYHALKETSRQYSNVKTVIPKTPYDIYDVFGHKIFSTHGDSVLNAGNPGKGIKTASVEAQINRINSAFKDSSDCVVFQIGHTHVPSITHLGNGATLVTNGALVPVDEFAVSLGLMESSPGQMLYESTPDYPVGDIRYIRVSKDTDNDISLEKIIKPFTWN